MYLPYPHQYRVDGVPEDAEGWVYLDGDTWLWTATLEGGEISIGYETKEEAEKAVLDDYNDLLEDKEFDGDW